MHQAYPTDFGHLRNLCRRRESHRPGPFVEEGEHAKSGAGQSAGGIQHALQNGVEVETLVYALAGLAQPGKAVPQCFIFLYEFFGGFIFVSLSGKKAH